MRAPDTATPTNYVRVEGEKPEPATWTITTTASETTVVWLDIDGEALLRSLPSSPTPEPTPAPAPSATAYAASAGCPDVIVETFGVNAPAACAIATCESGLDPDAVGDHGASLSYFQIQPRWHQWRADALFGPGADLMDPEVNVAVAYQISGGGRDWSAWTCRWVAG